MSVNVGRRSVKVYETTTSKKVLGRYPLHYDYDRKPYVLTDESMDDKVYVKKSDSGRRRGAFCLENPNDAKKLQKL